MPVFAGWGFKSDAQPRAFANCWQQACDQLPWLSGAEHPLVFAQLHSRQHTPAGIALSGWAATSFSQLVWLSFEEADIRHITTASMSARLLKRFGTGSVSEALALCAAQTQASATLLLPRIVSQDRSATLAIAAIQSDPHLLETGVLP